MAKCKTRFKTKQALTMMDAVFLTVGTMIGAGVFSVFGLTVKTAGPSAMLAWIFVVLFSLPMAYIFSDLTGALAESGGPYVYLRNKWPWLGLWVAWLFLLSSIGAAVGLYISLIGMFEQFGLPYAQWIGLPILLSLLVVVSQGIHFGVRFQKWLSIGTILLLVMCIIIGFCHVRPPIWLQSQHSANALGLWQHFSFLQNHSFSPHGWFACAAAAFFAFWTYSGWEAVAVPSNAYQSKKHLAFGMLVGSMIVGLLYISVAVSALLSVPTEKIAAAMNPLVFVGNLAGPWVGAIVEWGSVVVVVSSLLSWLLTCSSLFQSVARDGLIPAPKFVFRIHGEYHPFWTVITGIIILLLSSLPIFTGVIAASSLTALIAYAAIFITVASDTSANWDGFIKHTLERRLWAGLALATTLFMITISGWHQLWPTLCLTACGGGIVLSQRVMQLRKV